MCKGVVLGQHPMQLPGKELDKEVIVGSETLVVAIAEDRIAPETRVGEAT